MTPEKAIADAQREVQLMMRSRYFKIIHQYFVSRREALFREKPTSSFDLAVNRGQLLEVTQFLHHPELIAKAQEIMEQADSAPTQEPEDNPWLRGILAGSIAGGEDLV